MPASLENPKVLLGASAGVIGLVGTLAGFGAVGYWGYENRVLAERLRIAGLMIVLQLIFDQLSPTSSSFLHVSALICGALLAIPFSLSHFSRRMIAASASS